MEAVVNLTYFDNAESLEEEVLFVQRLVTGFFTHELVGMKETPEQLVDVAEVGDKRFKVTISIEEN